MGITRKFHQTRKKSIKSEKKKKKKKGQLRKNNPDKIFPENESCALVYVRKARRDPCTSLPTLRIFFL